MTEDIVHRPLGFFHGASPTAFYCGNNLLSMMETRKKGQPEATSKKISQSESQDEMDFEVEEGHPSGYTRLHVSASLGEANLVEQFLDNMEASEMNQQDRNGLTALMWAALQGNDDTVQVLVDNGASLNMQNFKGETALFLAASRGHTDVCRTLLENGAEPNLGNMEAVTPAHVAAVSGYVEVLQVLTEHGAFVNAQDEEGDTLLHYAVREGQGKVVEYLVLHAKASVNIPNEDLETPLEVASCLGETRMVEFLSLYQGKESEHEGTFAMIL